MPARKKKASLAPQPPIALAPATESPGAPTELESLRSRVIELTVALAGAKAEIAALRPPPAPAPGEIRLQFVAAGDLSSRLIEWFGFGSGGFSHVDAVMPDGWLLGERSDTIKTVNSDDGTVMIIPPGMRLRPPGYARWIRRSLVTIHTTQEIAEAWEQSLRTDIGEPYDREGILGIATGEDLHRKGAWFCSARQIQTLEKFRIVGNPGCLPWQVTPNTLRTMLCGLGAEREALP